MKKKLTSVFSLVLALSMLLSTAAMAADVSSMDPQTIEESSYTEPIEEPVEEPAEAPVESEEEPVEPVEEPAEEPEKSEEEPLEPAEEPAEEPDETEDLSPEAMTAVTGWNTTTEGGKIVWEYTYVDKNGDPITAGNAETYHDGKMQILYLPKQDYSHGGTTVAFAAGFYAFTDGVWAENYTCTETFFENIVEIQHDSASYMQVPDASCQYTDKLLMTFKLNNKKQSVGALFTGRSSASGKQLRYEDGVPYTGWGLGTQTVPNLYYYYKGDYTTKTSRNKLDADAGYGLRYHIFEKKLYRATDATLDTKSTHPYAAPVTGRWTNPKDGVKRRYEKGTPFTGYALGTQTIPNLYYYKNGLYCKTTNKSGTVVYDGAVSKTKMEVFSGAARPWNKKWYLATDATLDTKSTHPYAAPFTGFGMWKSKMYQCTKGTGTLYTGIYTGKEANLKSYVGCYYVKGVKQAVSGWKTIGGKRYYFKNNKALIGWNYVKCNGTTYYYYFDKTGAQVTDLFSYFGSSYKSKKMLLQINRYTHTADILLYNSKTGKYDIPAKSFVASTPVEAKNFKIGTHSLSYRRRWWSFKNPDTGYTSYYQYAMRVAGTPASLIHSSSYSQPKPNTLSWRSYNKIGSNQSYYCIRLQCGNCKLLYDCVGKQGQKKVKVKFYSSSNEGPNGKITLANSTGKVPKGTKYDPTDPAAPK